MATSIGAVDQTAPGSWASEATQKGESNSSNDVSKEVFLQLLVAQIQNQDPLNPMDGAEYVSQLAEFSNLEQLITLGNDVETIRDAVLSNPLQTDANLENQVQQTLDH